MGLMCLWEFTGDIMQVVAASGTVIQSTKVREKKNFLFSWCLASAKLGVFNDQPK
jgi:hypothetical protein